MYHLIKDEVFDSYIGQLFDPAKKFVIDYSSNKELASHVKRWKFTQWVQKHRPQWAMIEHIPNRFSVGERCQTRLLADF